MKAWPFLLFALLAGCAHAPRPEAITRIVLSRSSCDARCTFAQFVLYPDGRVKYTSGLRFNYYGRMPLQEYRELAGDLVQTPGAFGPRWNYLPNPSYEPQSTIWTDYSAGHWQVSFPTTGQVASADTTINHLNGWARIAAIEAGGAIMRSRQKEIALRERTDRLQRVIFESRGCFGRCPAYRAVFEPDGAAMLKRAMYVPGVVGGRAADFKARVPFGKVASLLLASNFGTLDPEYPLRVVDVYGVSFEFDYRDGSSFSVLAPDRTQWPPQVAQLVGSFQQLIRDTDWMRVR